MELMEMYELQFQYEPVFSFQEKDMRLLYNERKTIVIGYVLPFLKIKNENIIRLLASFSDKTPLDIDHYYEELTFQFELDLIGADKPYKCQMQFKFLPNSFIKVYLIFQGTNTND